MTVKSYQNEFEKRAKELVAKMTLEEKVFQTLHSAPSIKRLGVKAYNYWNEALHGVARAGVATVFPQAIALAATFDEALIEKVADTISTEGRGKFNSQQKHGDTDIYKGLTFWSPNVNIFRDPRWGRGHETYGEDPYLSSRLGVRFVQGIQGKDEKYLKAAACAKHFAVHSGPEELRHSFDAKVTKQDLRETYLPAFKALVKEAKVEAVMGAYNRVNGEPCCASKYLLEDILRGEWEFEGHVSSDCWAIKDFHEYHMVTKTPVESVCLAMNHGCDLNCGNLYVHLLPAVQQGLVKEETIDRAVVRLLTTRMKLGLFDDDNQVPYSDISFHQVDTKEHQEFNLEVSRKSLVLLKNENHLLPLNIKSVNNIGVIGPNANNRKALVGNYEGTSSEYITVLEGIKEYVGDKARVFYSEGCHLFKNKISGLSQDNDRISEVRAVCENSDVVIACFGLDPSLEGEEGDEGNEFASGDKKSLNLPGIQEEVLKEIYASKKPVILVLLSGSALAVGWADRHIPAIIQGWYPGAQGGRAIAQLIFGECSPEAKLPITFYASTEELPDFTQYSMKDRTYRYMKQEALYPFGYGLSYLQVEQLSASINVVEVKKDAKMICRTSYKNLSDQAGSVTVQVYIKCSSQEFPNAQLKGFKKVYLNPMEEKEVEIELTDRSFGLYDELGNFRLYQGTYQVYIGESAPDVRSCRLMGNSPYLLVLRCNENTILGE